MNLKFYGFLLLCIYSIIGCASNKNNVSIETFELSGNGLNEEELNMIQKNFKSKEKSIEYLHYYSKVMELWPHDYEGYYVVTDYGKTWINEIGDKNLPPLLLLHGMSGSSTLWYPNVDYLSKYFRIIAPDIIGQAGKSLLIKPLKSSVDLEKWLDQVIDELKLDQVYLCGMSFGGWLATKYAVFEPNKVKKLVLLDPAATFLPLKSEFYFKMFSALLFPNSSTGKSFENWLTQGYQMNDDYSKQMTIGMMDYKPMKGQKTILAKELKDSELKKLNMPVMVLIGSKCVIYDREKVIKKANKLLQNVKTETIMDCGHAMNMEKAEIINGKIKEYLLENI